MPSSQEGCDMSSPRRIDVHHHLVPPSYAQWLRERGLAAGGLPIPDWSAQASLELMDERGVETAILSVSTPGVHLAGDAEARARAREVNEFAAKVVHNHPVRFGFFATLTLPDVDGALAELAYAFDTLRADGVVLLANSRGVYLGDPCFDPLFDELNRRQAVVLVHPSTLPGPEALPGVPAFVADFLLDTTRAAIGLARSGTLDRCPDLEVILSHAGGFVPYAAYRIALAASATGKPLEGIARLKRFHFDTALSSSPTALPSLLAFAEPAHVLFGSDFPYAPAGVVAAFSGLYEKFPLSDAQRASIDRGAAERLFPRLRKSG
jgi:predicted TIM-barrel fold metal-dependent hydrolase